MSYQYYLFAFYIFILLCIVVYLSRYLFSDLKNQRKLLEEKETKLLRLYQTLEELMDEFYDSVRESKTEIIDAAAKAAATIGEVQTAPALPAVETVPDKQGKLQALNKTALSDDSAEPPFKELFAAAQESAPDISSMTRTEAILVLNKQGKSRAAIAQELNITLSEVDLVIGINKKGSKN